MLKISRANLATATAVVILLGHLTASYADNGRIPVNLYPSHAQITTYATLSNAQVDCLWGFSCVSANTIPFEPLFHSQNQDALRRLDGWGQGATWSQRSRIMVFALFASRFNAGLDANGVPWNKAAIADLRLASRAQGYVSIPLAVNLLRAGNHGGTLAMSRHSQSFDSIVLACWTGSYDVEAVALYDHGSIKGRQTALHDLIRQVQAAAAHM